MAPVNGHVLSMYVKPVLSSQPDDAQKEAAKGKWLLNRGLNETKLAFMVIFVCLLKAGGCLIKVTTYTGSTVVFRYSFKKNLVQYIFRQSSYYNLAERSPQKRHFPYINFVTGMKENRTL